MIDLQEARDIAYNWHGGEGSPLYSFASTGDIANISQSTIDEVEGDIYYCQNEPGYRKELRDLGKLRLFLLANMPKDDEQSRMSN